jgi:hypothetical protein
MVNIEMSQRRGVPSFSASTGDKHMAQRFKIGDSVKDLAETKSGIIIEIFIDRVLVHWIESDRTIESHSKTWENIDNILHLHEEFDDL